jgi:ubiquinone biosynthesis protein COQ4
MRTHGFSADGLVASEAEAAKSTALIEHPHAWYARRIRDLHDVWHVLTGYDTDALGEACIVAFSYAQTRQLGFAVIALGAAQEMRRGNRSIPSRRAVLEAYRTGRRARRLVGLDYEKLFALPLETARRELGIRPATVYASIPEATRRQLMVRMPKELDETVATTAMH